MRFRATLFSCHRILCPGFVIHTECSFALLSALGGEISTKSLLFSSCLNKGSQKKGAHLFITGKMQQLFRLNLLTLCLVDL